MQGPARALKGLKGMRMLQTIARVLRWWGRVKRPIHRVLERVLTKSHTQVKLLSSISKPKVEEEEKPPKGQPLRKHLKCLEPVVEEEGLVKALNLGDKVRLPRVNVRNEELEESL